MAKLLTNMPNGTLIKFGKHQVGSETAQPIVWMVVDKNHSGFPTNSVTLITQKIIDLRPYDALQGRSDELYNYIDYKTSNIHQWLNSSAASNWYKESAPTYDHPPEEKYVSHGTQYASRPGFLYNFTQVERNAILPTTLTLGRSNNTYPTISAMVFLPTHREILGATNYDDNTSRFSYFSSNEVGCGLTEQAYVNTLSSYKPSTKDGTWTYWTRTPYTVDSIYTINYGGSINAISTETGYGGIRPCLNLSTDTKISDSPDSNGYYTVLEQHAPVISGTNSDLGIKSAAFSQSYTVTDVDNEPVTVTEYLDNVKVRSYVATLGASNTFAITGTTWLKLANGIHTMKITATDGFDEVTRTFTFTKSVTKLVAQRATPFDSTTQPKSILATVVKVIPEGAIFKVEACNNGYDASPTWEDITTRVNQGRIYDFANTAKTAGKWGVNIRVTVDRNGKEGACYITEIGGNFE